MTTLLAAAIVACACSGDPYCCGYSDVTGGYYEPDDAETAAEQLACLTDGTWLWAEDLAR